MWKRDSAAQGGPDTYETLPLWRIAQWQGRASHISEHDLLGLRDHYAVKDHVRGPFSLYHMLSLAIYRLALMTVVLHADPRLLEPGGMCERSKGPPWCYRGDAKKRDVRIGNINAAKTVADAVRTSLGPRGMDKMVRSRGSPCYHVSVFCTPHSRKDCMSAAGCHNIIHLHVGKIWC